MNNGYSYHVRQHPHDLTPHLRHTGPKVRRPSFGESLVTAAQTIAHPLSRMDTAGGMYLIGIVTGLGLGAAFVLWMTR